MNVEIFKIRVKMVRIQVGEKKEIEQTNKNNELRKVYIEEVKKRLIPLLIVP